MVGRPNRRGWGWIRRLPSKRFQASYMGPDLRRHYAAHTFTARMDAEGWLAAERRLIERDEWTAPAARRAQKMAKSVTVAQYAQSWLAQRTLKPRTLDGYQSLLDRNIIPTIGATPLTELTPEMVRRWYSSLGPGHPSVNARAYSLLHAVLATAVSDEALPVNPCTIKRANRAPRQREPVILTVAEVARVADAISPELRALVLISAWCGLRWGEVAELRRKDVSEGAEVITVARGVTHRKGCRIDSPKSGKGRVVVVPPHIRGDIEAHMTYVAKDAGALLFPAPHGGCHLDAKMFRTHFNRALKTVGREGVRVHDLRHFAGTQTARVGGSLADTMSRLGHSTSGASLIYQHAVSGRDAELAEALSRLAEEPIDD